MTPHMLLTLMATTTMVLVGSTMFVQRAGARFALMVLAFLNVMLSMATLMALR